MKKLTLFLMACAVAVMGFAQGGNITYELNGGVTNPDGWTNKADMLVALNADYNTHYSVAEGATWYTWETLETIMAATNPVARIPTFASNMWGVVKTEKWLWLHDYIVATVASQGVAELEEKETAYWRYNVSAFFINGKRASWPISADYIFAGQEEAFMPAWKNGFAGPATYDGSAEILLPTPFKEGFTFAGWYANAEFSGNRVLSIPAGETGDKKFYAKWVDKIPNLAEVLAMEVDQTTKTIGSVSFVLDKNVYIQDVTAGMLLTFADTPDLVIGDKVVVSAKVAANGTYKKLVDITIEEKIPGKAPAMQTLTLAGLKANIGTYIYEWVQIFGLEITTYNADGTAILADDAENTITLALKLPQAQYPVGTKIDFKGVVDFAEDVQLNSTIENIKKSPVPQPDPFAYSELGDGKYTLKSNWLVSANLDNLGANPIGKSNFVRGMAAKDGKMYFVDRELKQLTVVDGGNGEKLAPIKLAKNIFTYVNADGDTITAGTNPFNDIKLDAAGNVLLGNCILSNKEMFQVWKIDLATGKGTLVVEEMLNQNPDFVDIKDLRFDAFGVYGDVTTGDAYIMACNAAAMEVYKWEITDGVAAKADMISVKTDVEGNFLYKLESPGYAPQVFPLDQDYFYLDGFSTYPTLIDMEGNVRDGFHNNKAAMTDSITSPGNHWKIGTGQNGLVEFEMGGEHFFIIGASNTDGTPPATFRLYKWKDEGKAFADMETMWTFPAAGLGSNSNQYRTAVPSVEVDESAQIATIYLYYGENGYGVYEFKISSTDVKTVYDNDAVKLSLQNRTLVFDKEVASVSVYSVTGQLVATDTKVSRIDVNSQGIFLVKATTYEGETAVHKVIIK